MDRKWMFDNLMGKVRDDFGGIMTEMEVEGAEETLWIVVKALEPVIRAYVIGLGVVGQRENVGSPGQMLNEIVKAIGEPPQSVVDQVHSALDLERRRNSDIYRLMHGIDEDGA